MNKPVTRFGREAYVPVQSYLHTTVEPFRFEAEIWDCEVEGEVPRELNGSFYRCGGNTGAPHIELGANPVVTTTMEGYTTTMVCFPDGDSDSKEEMSRCQSACGDPFTVSQTTTVFDAATGDPLLAVEQNRDYKDDSEPRRSTNVLVRPDGVQLLGGGCNQFEPFVKAAPAASR